MTIVTLLTLLLLVPAPVAASAPQDTVMVVREVYHDMTADGVLDVLRLTAQGDPHDSVQVHLTIHSGPPGDELLFEESWPVTRRVGWGTHARIIPRAEMPERIAGWGDFLFDPGKFQTPAGFLATLRESRRTHPGPHVDIARQLPSRDTVEAKAVWRDMARAGVTVYGFSSGGDRAVEIAWSPMHRRFFYINVCC